MVVVMVFGLLTLGPAYFLHFSSIFDRTLHAMHLFMDSTLSGQKLMTDIILSSSPLHGTNESDPFYQV